MDERGSEPDTDRRALDALAALREGREVEPRARLDLAALLDRVEALTGRRPATVVLAASCAAAVLLGAAAWWLARPGPSASGTPGLFSEPVAPAGIGGTGGGTSTATDGGVGPSASEPGSPAGVAPTTAADRIVVHAAGAVARPGLHQLPAGARVDDLLGAAGGATPEADLDRLNLAAELADGQRLYVPRVGEPAPGVVAPDGPGGPAGDQGPSPAAPTDLNSATADELDALPGVGPATASAIVDHRQRHGPFATVDGLLEVRGIGPAKLEALRDLVTVG